MNFAVAAVDLVSDRLCCGWTWRSNGCGGGIWKWHQRLLLMFVWTTLLSSPRRTGWENEYPEGGICLAGTPIIKQLRENKELRGVVFVSANQTTSLLAQTSTWSATAKRRRSGSTGAAGATVNGGDSCFAIPVIAAIHGACLGGGLELAWRATVVFVLTILKRCSVCLNTTWIVTRFRRYPAFTAPDRFSTALEMILTGKQLRAKQAVSWGWWMTSFRTPYCWKPLLSGKAGSPIFTPSTCSRAYSGGPLGRALLFKMVGKKTEHKTKVTIRRQNASWRLSKRD